MDGNPVGAGFREGRNERVRILDHQVTIQDSIRERFAKGRDYGRPESDVRDEVPIHNVEMKDRTAALERRLGGIAEFSEIRRQ